MNNFEKQQYEFLIKKRNDILLKGTNKNSRKISKAIKEIDDEMDYRDYNEEW